MVLQIDRPDWCPQRVWDEARAILDSYLYGKMSPDEAIARVILAAEQREREACALVAETRSPDDDKLDFQVRQQVATAIRNRSQAQ